MPPSELSDCILRFLTHYTQLYQIMVVTHFTLSFMTWLLRKLSSKNVTVNFPERGKIKKVLSALDA
jgi:hypothetical protein